MSVAARVARSGDMPAGTARAAQLQPMWLTRARDWPMARRRACETVARHAELLYMSCAALRWERSHDRDARI